MKGFKIRVTLTDFKKQIYRVMEVREDIKLEEFCEDIIYSFNGMCYHMYSLKSGATEYMPDSYSGDFDEDITSMKGKKLKSLKLVKGEKLLLNYDFGDDWMFIITISKIIEDYKYKTSRIIDGKGYGIVEDCGGIWGLSDIMQGNINEETKEWLR